MSYKDQATPDKQFGIWVSTDVDNPPIAIEILKDFAEDHGCDRESMYDFARLEKPWMDTVSYKARFKEKK